MPYVGSTVFVVAMAIAAPAAAANSPLHAVAACDDGNAATTESCLTASGCASLGTVAGTDTTIRGNASGGTLFVDGCPAGQVMVGIAGSVGASWDQVQVVCGAPSLSDTPAVTLAAGATLPLRGTNVNVAVTSMCPADQVVIGFDGRAGALMDQIALRCAPVTFAVGSSAYTVTLGTAAAVTPVGGSGGSEFATTDCAAGELALGANIRAGGSTDGFGLICGGFAATHGTDRDCDAVLDGADNCAANENPDQADLDGDGLGDACDSIDNGPEDRDQDGVPDDQDNCTDQVNSDQLDLDQDGIGDVCEAPPAGCVVAPMSGHGRDAGLAGILLAGAMIVAARRRR